MFTFTTLGTAIAFGIVANRILGVVVPVKIGFQLLGIGFWILKGVRYVALDIFNGSFMGFGILWTTLLSQDDL